VEKNHENAVRKLSIALFSLIFFDEKTGSKPEFSTPSGAPSVCASTKGGDQMQELARQARAFSDRNEEAVSEARQRAALQILCGVNFDEALCASSEQRAALVQRLERALKVERLKGLKRHWSYDLNRHIALKQALDRLRATGQK